MYVVYSNCLYFLLIYFCLLTISIFSPPKKKTPFTLEAVCLKRSLCFIYGLHTYNNYNNCIIMF